MKTKLLNVNQVLLDRETYPRVSLDWVTLARYMGAMESGAKFPPICVGFFDGRYYLIDGNHRLEATKGRKEQHISAEVLVVKDKREVYLEAVKRNISHGKPFSVQDVTNVMITLEDWNMSKEQIAEIVRVPAARIDAFIAKRAVMVTNSEGGLDQRKALRRPLTHMAGSTQNSDFNKEQNTLVGTDQIHLLDMVIKMIKNNWFNLEDEDVLKKMGVLSKHLEKIVPKVDSKDTGDKDFDNKDLEKELADLVEGVDEEEKKDITPESKDAKEVKEEPKRKRGRPRKNPLSEGPEVNRSSNPA